MSRYWLAVGLILVGYNDPVESPSTPAPSIAPVESGDNAATDLMSQAVDEAVTETTPPPTSDPPATESKRSLDELLLFQPLKLDPATSPPVPAPFELLRLAADDGVEFTAWFAEAQLPAARVLVLHGNGSNLFGSERFLDWLVRDVRCSVLAVDYRGYGLSDGEPTVDGVLRDSRAACQELQWRTGVTSDEVILIGHSLAGAIAVQLAAESPPRALVLQSTISSLADVAKVHYGKVSLLIPTGRLDSVAAIHRFHGPILQSHGDIDVVVPLDLGVKLHEAAHEPKRFMRLNGADHNRILTAEYLRELKGFLHHPPPPAR
jgi:pimeloyl-ACP methyl ester carboxylesterase